MDSEQIVKDLSLLRSYFVVEASLTIFFHMGTFCHKNGMSWVRICMSLRPTNDLGEPFCGLVSEGRLDQDSRAGNLLKIREFQFQSLASGSSGQTMLTKKVLSCQGLK